MRYILMFLIAIVCFYSPVEAQQKPGIPFFVNEQDVTNLGNQLVRAIVPTLPENAYMPAFMKEKISWVYELSEKSKRSTGQEVVVLIRGEAKYGNTFMRSFYTSRTYPHIEIISNMLFFIVRIADNVPTGYTPKNKNDFGVALVHEAVHLEQPRSFFNRHRTQQEMIEEEFRTWSKVDTNVVEPLIKMGQPLDSVYISNHRELVACKYKLPCESVTRNIIVK
ncbi:MAG: hypothetical protein WAW92_00865 [Minisyncoccia bacterium]